MSYKNLRITGIPAPLPADYDRQVNFADFEILNPGDPPRGVDLDAEFNALEQAVDETQDRLALIQRDDGALMNESVGLDQLKNEARVGVNTPSDWEPFTQYAINDSVIVNDGAWYISLSSHVSSGTFQDDLDAGLWAVLIDLTPYTTEARNWATRAEDDPVPEGDGTEYSSLHHAAKAMASEIAAQLAQQNAEDARDITTDARDTTLDARDTTLDARDTAVAAETDFTNKWQGLLLTPPTLRPDGTALQEGDAYTDGNTGAINLYLSGAWDAVTDYTRRTSPTGSAIIPAGTTAERDPAPGADKLLRFNTETGLFEGYNGTGWVPVGSGATGAEGDQVFVENDQVVTADYTIPSGKNAASTGPITINNGVTVTVSDGARWLIS